MCRSQTFRGHMLPGPWENSSWSPQGNMFQSENSNAEIVPSYFSLVRVFLALLAYLQGWELTPYLAACSILTQRKLSPRRAEIYCPPPAYTPMGL